MTKNTKIEWAHHTFNPWIGCTKVSPACDQCYAENMMDTRLKVVKWGAGHDRKRTSESNWQQPIKWDTEAKKLGVRHRVFCASLADVFDNEVPEEWRDDLFKLIEATPNLDWLLLTKRIGNVGNMLPVPFDLDRLYPNVWIGATICSQEEADRDIPKLLRIPAAKRFLSIEPLLGFIDLHMRGNLFEDDDGAPYQFVDWVIVGGESGNQARPMHPEWVRSLRDQCVTARVSFLFKQWGEWCPETVHCTDKAAESALYIATDGETRPAAFGARNGATTIQRVGKKASGRLLDGREWNEVPL
ncbi:MAG: phage Gp37/Gp68 family protein [Burkholderiaceae bacterium]|nr:phage Gp37/Gp68 family protein [Burkholderiaceae bacterium]